MQKSGSTQKYELKSSSSKDLRMVAKSASSPFKSGGRQAHMTVKSEKHKQRSTNNRGGVSKYADDASSRHENQQKVLALKEIEQTMRYMEELLKSKEKKIQGL